MELNKQFSNTPSIDNGSHISVRHSLKNLIQTHSSSDICCAIGSGLAMGAAWIFPASWLAVPLGVISVFLLLCIVDTSRHSHRLALLAGFIQFTLACYWFPSAVYEFTQFSFFPQLIIFSLFSVWHALQLVTFSLLYRQIPSILDRFAIRGALAWCTAETLWPRLFDWSPAHTLFAATPLIQTSELLGTTTISFFIFWTIELIYRNKRCRLGAYSLSLGFMMLLFVTMYGMVRIIQLNLFDSEQLMIGVVQVHKSSTSNSLSVYKKYLALSKQVPSNTDLVIWPEGAIANAIHESIAHSKNDSYIPHLSDSTALIFGASAYRPPHKFFKSAFAVLKDGSIPIPYHKKTFVPFGEYSPLGEITDWRSYKTGQWQKATRGEHSVVFSIKANANSKSSIKVAPLICYEDTLATHVLEVVRQGAQILVSLSAAQWNYSALPLEQHFLISAFRTVETRRSLIRATGGARTTMIGPTGQELESLLYFRDGVMVQNVPALQSQTLYQIVGNSPWWFLSFVVFALILFKQIISSDSIFLLLQRAKS